MTAALGLALLGFGIILIWSAITGQNIAAEFRATFR